MILQDRNPQLFFAKFTDGDSEVAVQYNVYKKSIEVLIYLRPMSYGIMAEMV